MKIKAILKKVVNSQVIGAILNVTPFGRIVTTIKESVSPEVKEKGYWYLITYLGTGALIWLFIIGKLDRETLEYLISLINQ